MTSENANTYNDDDRNPEGRRCLIWVGHQSRFDPEDPFEAVVLRDGWQGELLLAGDSVPYLVVHHDSPYAEFLLKRENDYLVQGCHVMACRPLEPPKLTEPPELPTYYYWEKTRRGEFWRILVWCPECETVHLHGGGVAETPSLGHRAEHCLPGSAYSDTGYVLADPKLIQGVCPKGHDYRDTALITADGFYCGRCKKDEKRAEARRKHKRSSDI